MDANYLPDKNWEFDLSFGYTSPSYDGYKVGESICGSRASISAIFGIDAYSRPITFGFALTAKY